MATVLMGLNDSENYFDFLPIVCNKWKKLGFEPFVGFIESKTKKMSNEYKHITFRRVKDVPSSHHSKLARTFLLNFLDEDEIVIYSDIDMMPLQKEFFNSLVDIVEKNPNKIVCSGADHRRYGKENKRIYPVCYMVGKVKSFLDVFNPERLDADILLKSWFNTKVYCDTEAPNTMGKFSDETLYRTLFNKWGEFDDRIIEHARGWTNIGKGSFADNRYDRGYKKLDICKLNDGKYIDSHLPRPPKDHMKEINTLYDGWSPAQEY